MVDTGHHHVVKKQRCQLNSAKDPPENRFHHVTGLFTICIEYVAKNIHLVDSLNGFPDIVGFKIFEKAKQLDKFQSATPDMRVCLGLFCEAYGSLVLSSLNLRSCHLGIADYLDHLCLFTELTELDIGHCGLGDDHELLKHLSDCHRLVKLGLCNNALSDVGLQKLTTPLRMFNRGPTVLQDLDLSDNADITFRVSRYLKSLHTLQRLNLSGTSVRQSQLSNLEVELGLKSCPDLCPEHGFQTETRGWAAEMVSDWMTHTAQRTKVVKPKTKTGKFYHRKVVLQDPVNHKVEGKPVALKLHSILYFVRKTSDDSLVHKLVPSERQREAFCDPRTKNTGCASFNTRHPSCAIKRKQKESNSRPQEVMNGQKGDAQNDIHLLNLYSSSTGKNVQSQDRVSLGSMFNSW